MKKQLDIGSWVGAKRWPGAKGNPRYWERPLCGILLAQTDPRVWVGSYAFPGNKFPTQKEVLNHLLDVGGPYPDRVPVQWNSGALIWEKIRYLLPYEEDIKEWKTARKEAQKTWTTVRRPFCLANLSEK